jgi:hypothetical protein
MIFHVLHIVCINHTHCEAPVIKGHEGGRMMAYAITFCPMIRVVEFISLERWNHDASHIVFRIRKPS